MESSGAEEIIESLSRNHAGALMGWAQRRFADPRDAEEVVAECLVRAWRGLDQFDPERGSERAWLFGIARNAAADHHRKGSRRLHAEPGGDDIDLVVADAEIERFVESSHIRDALDALSDEHRAALIEAYYYGRTTTEIARRLDIPAGTVKSRLYYGLKAIRAQLEERGMLR